jgi:hypothetical protein
MVVMASVSEKYGGDPNVKNEGSRSPPSSLAEAVGINEKALLRKLDYRLLPPLTLLYLLSFLDRSNVGNARLEGMTDDINMCMLCSASITMIDS